MDREIYPLSELYDALDHDPSNVYVHEALLEAWKELGDEGNEAASHPNLPRFMSIG
jgi:hypothetical protein